MKKMLFWALLIAAQWALPGYTQSFYDYQVPNNVGTWTGGMHFFNDDMGWACALGGNIHRTTDGGATWQTINYGGANDLNDIFFIDAKMGWAVGAGGTALKSTDGGATWATLNTGTALELSDVVFVDAQRGWAAAGAGFGSGNNASTLFRTTDGGTSWTAVALPTPGRNANALDFVNANIGYIACDARTVFKTVDGGASWTSIPVPTALPPTGNLTFYALDALDANTVVVAGTNNSFYRTTDGGVTWQAATGATGAIQTRDLCFWDATQGVAVGNGGRALTTADGGATWTPVQPLPAAYATYALYACAAPSPGAIYVGGQRGIIAKSTDGGLTWSIGTYMDISGNGLAIAFQDETSGIAGGSLGSTTRLLQTTNGGDTWSVLRAGIPGTAIEAVEYVGPNTVLVANANGAASGIFRSTDNGLSFQPAVLTGTPSASAPNACLDLFKINSDLVVGCGRQGRFFKSVNGGANWTVSAAVGYAPNFKVTGTSPTSCGGANGSLVFSGLDPNTTYAVSYSKNYGPQTAPGFYTTNASGILSIPGLSAGLYNSFEVSLNGCRGTSNTGIALADPGAPTFNIGTTPPTICGSATGQIALTGTGATGLLANTTYSISYWHNGAVVGPANYTTDANRQILLTGLVAGVYANIAVSVNGCVRPTSVAALVQEPGTVAFTAEATPPSVCDGSDGGIVLANLAPNTTYTFRFTSNGNEANPISATTDANGFFAVSNLSAGIYPNIRVTNPAGCLRVAEGIAISDRSSPDLHAVHFVNEKVGYMVGGQGTVLKTANGGTTWLTQPIPSPAGSAADLSSVFFSDEQNGHCCGLGGSIYRTTDGGNTWTRYSATPFPGNPSFQKIHFYDKNNGIVFSSSGVTYITKNGGNTWEPEFNIVPDAIQDAFMLNRKVGYVVGAANDGFTIVKMEHSCVDLFAATTKPSVKVSIGLDDPFDCYAGSTADSIAAAEACKFKGVAWLSAQSFDDGSYDLCGPVKLTIRRMPKHFKQVNGVAVPVYNDVIESLNKEDGYSRCEPNDGAANSTSQMFMPGTPLASTGFDPFGPTCTPGFKPWKPTEYQRAWLEQDSVKFYSDEVGTRDTVILRIYEVGPSGCPRLDGKGNYVYNEALIAVDIVDRMRPMCTAPAHITVSCETFEPSLSAYGQAKVEDNCCLDMDKIYRGQCGLTHSVNYARFDSACNKGTIVRTFNVFDCSGNSSTCIQRVVVTYTLDDYYIRFPDDRIVTSCVGATYGEPVLFGVDCELTNITFRDDTFTVVPDACYKVERTWKVINWCTYDPNCELTRVTNPTPHAMPNNSINLPGPIVSNINGCDPATIGNPWRSSCVRVTPTDANATNYTRFWQLPTSCLPSGSKFNGYQYLQIIKIIDGSDPVPQCAKSDTCDITDNDPNFWNVDYWWDPIHNSRDLCEMPIDLKITATDACSGSRINFRYLLFLDLDANGTTETVVSSSNLPPANTIYYNNINNPNYTSGQARAFDRRLVLNPALDWYRFALQVTRSGENATAAVRFNTVRQPTNYVLPQIPHGRHRIKWILEDGCGNEAVCEQKFEVKDGKAPAVFCKPLSVNITPTGTVTLWTSDFLEYALDNCTPTNQLVLGLSTDAAPAVFPRDRGSGLPIESLTFDCTEVGVHMARLWAEDRLGNAGFCEVVLLVQDNANLCGQNATVAGALKTLANQGIEGATVKLSGGHPSVPPFDFYQLSDAMGNYRFLNTVPPAGNYIVKPDKTDNPLNGVTTLDLALISKHILGTQMLGSPYDILAADANKSGTITTFDVVELRKLILGVYDELPNNTAWRFIKKSYMFADPTNPFASAFPESSVLSDIQGDRLDEHFVGIKIGDVNGTALGNNLMSADDRTTGTALFDVEDRAVKAGEVFEVKFKSSGRVPAYQFTMNHAGLEVVDIVPGAEMGLDNFGVFSKDAVVTTSWNGDAAQAEFTVKFRAVQNGLLSKMLGVSSRITKAVSYLDGEQRDVAFRFNNGKGSVVSGVGFELYQNTPNPFADQTTIGFHLPQASKAVLSVYDEAGKLVHRQEGAFAKGVNRFVLERSLAPTTGLLYYTVETDKARATRAMAQME